MTKTRQNQVSCVLLIAGTSLQGVEAIFAYHVRACTVDTLVSPHRDSGFTIFQFWSVVSSGAWTLGEYNVLLGKVTRYRLAG